MTEWRRWLPHPALAFVVLVWGLNFSVIKIAYRDFDPATLGLVRYLIMVPLIATWCLASGQTLKYPAGSFLRLNFAGFVGSGVYMVLFLEGMKRASPAIGAICLATTPVLTSVWSGIFRLERMGGRHYLGSVVAFLGVGVSVWSPSPLGASPHVGAILILLSAVFWSVSLVLYRRILVDVNPVKAMALSFPGAAIALVPYGLGSTVSFDWNQVTSIGWTSLIYLVVVAGVLAFAAYYKGIADVGPSRASLIQFFIPPVAAVFSGLVLKVPVTWNEVLGLVVVIVGVAFAAHKPVKASE